MLQVPVASLVVILLLGSALLALWTLNRFERFGAADPRRCAARGRRRPCFPHRSRRDRFVEGVAATGLPHAQFVIAIGLVLPVFTYFFVASGWLMRVVRDLFAGIS